MYVEIFSDTTMQKILDSFSQETSETYLRNISETKDTLRTLMINIPILNTFSTKVLRALKHPNQYRMETSHLLAVSPIDKALKKPTIIAA